MKCAIIALFLAAPISVSAQQVADTLFKPSIKDPMYLPGQGPMVLIDEAHQNFHTRSGRFSPFASVLEADGYVVHSNTQPFSAETLRQGNILVIANALHISNVESWTLPTPSAFTDDEIHAMNEWVNGGGSLFLIADHMPFPGAAEKLAESFGFKFHNGFAIKSGGKDIFTTNNGLAENSITKGRNEGEHVTSIQTFTGQAFEIPAAATSVITLNEKYQIKLPQTAWVFNKITTSVIPADNLSQGAYMIYGKGRIVVFGEAAMFTAQRQGKSKIGMNASSASQNVQLLLNIIHWLNGRL